MAFAKPLAASAVWVAVLFGQAAPEPLIEINHPGPSANRFINLTLEGFEQHRFAVNDHGVSREVAGVHLLRLLETAGWRSIPADRRSQYLVRIEGAGEDTETLLLSDVLRRSLENRAWLVAERAEGPSLMVVGPGDVVTEKIENVRRIRVTNAATQRLGEDADFGRLSGYESEPGARILWREFVRVEGIAAMIVTWSTVVRHGKSAVLLSERVSGWNERRLRDFVAGPLALGIDPQATIERGAEFTVVRLRFPVWKLPEARGMYNRGWPGIQRCDPNTSAFSPLH